MATARTSVRIGCGAGFWGDSALGPAQLVRRGDIDVLVLDYLAEITMAILARMRQHRPDRGYAGDFVDHVMAPLAREIADKDVKVVTNAGGVNPFGCRDALARALAAAGVTRKIAVVTGDDVMSLVPDLRARGVRDLDTDEPLPEALLGANAYLGARPIAEALRLGADIVITGRCVDSALVLGPLLAAFGWSMHDHDRLAMGSLAGHVIECGAQATGGLFTDWREVEAGWADMGFPIVECEADGSFVLGKPPGTGGLISPATVAEQIVYEVHDPARYLLPDVICDLRDIRLEQVGPDRVRVSGARGHARPGHYKATLTHEDGHRLGTTLLLVGHEAHAKAARVGEAILDRVERVLLGRGLAPFRQKSVEVFGAEQSFGAAARALAPREVIVKIAAAHDDPAALEFLAREIAPAATAMAPSISGFAGGRPHVQPIVRLTSCLVPRAEVQAVVEFAGTTHIVDDAVAAGSPPPEYATAIGELAPAGPTTPVPLRLLAHGRSGDKGDTANIGVIARRPEYLPILRRELTAEFVANYFAHLVTGPVHRHEWPGLHAFNFVLARALAGGGVTSLRHDAQGKGLAQILLEAPVAVPVALAAGLGHVADDR